MAIPAVAVLEMATKENGALDWELNHIREAIASDWGALASGKLNFEQRRAVRDHLGMNQAALRDLMARRRAISVTERMHRLRGR